MHAETNTEKLARLREALKSAQEQLAEAGVGLAEQMAEINRLERRIQLRLGRLMEKLDNIQAEVDSYEKAIRQRRNQEAYDAGYLPVEDQYRQTWQVPEVEPEFASPNLPPKSEVTQIKRLYRQLARRYHPDLANDQEDLDFRTERMAALNEAYAAGSMVELLALGSDVEAGKLVDHEADDTRLQMIAVIEQELDHIGRRLRQIRQERDNLHNHPSVQLSLEVKLAQRSGRDLLGEMAGELKYKIGQKTKERDFLKAQLNR